MQEHTLGRGQERTQALDAASRDCIGTASMPHIPGRERASAWTGERTHIEPFHITQPHEPCKCRL